MRRRSCAIALAMLVAITPLLADDADQIDLPGRARGAEQVVVASVEQVDAEYYENEFGDRLIVSRARVRVREVLGGAGKPGDALTVDIEGGTVGEVTLRVSDMPSMGRGEQAVFFLSQNKRGRRVPHMRGQGILKVDANSRVQGTSLTVGDVRRAVSAR